METPVPGTSGLFSEFPPASRQEWEALIEKETGGADYKAQLTWDTLEGFGVFPFYLRDDLNTLSHNPSGYFGKPGPWKRTEIIEETGPDKTNALLLEAIRGGADSFQFTSAVNPDDSTVTGLQLQSQQDFSRLFEDISTEKLHLVFDCGMSAPILAAMLQNHTSSETGACFIFDPFTYTARHGKMPLKKSALSEAIRQLTIPPGMRTLAADGLFYQQAGGTMVQELGISLAVASEYLARAGDRLCEETASHICMRLSAGPLYFPEIAKFRAIRLLWPQLLAAYGADPSTDLWIHAQSTPSNQSKNGIHNNMIRNTLGAMAAVSGSADSLAILPHDAVLRKPGSFSRRIARNIHHILIEEAHFADTADPAAGSWYIEKMTDIIARKSWDYFRKIENQGGFLKALQSGIIRNDILESRKKKLTGTSPEDSTMSAPVKQDPVFPLQHGGSQFEISIHNLLPSLRPALQNGATTGDILQMLMDTGEVCCTPLEAFSFGKPFEEGAAS